MEDEQTIEWHDWAGGEMPVPASTYVGVQFRNGQVVNSDLAGGFTWQHAPNFDRSNPRHPGWWDIVRYQIWPQADAQLGATPAGDN